MTDDDAYVVAVADSLLFALGPEWQRLTAYDADVQRTRVQAAVSALGRLGARVSFGDGELPVVPADGALDVATLREQLRRIREIAPAVLARAEDSFARILCTDPYPRLYTTAVLDLPPTTPVHVVQASDLRQSPDQWARVGELARFRELRALVLFGSPLDSSPLPLDLAQLAALQFLDLSVSGLRALPAGLPPSLDVIVLARNPLDARALAPLAALPSLRYVDLRGTHVRSPDEVGAYVPASCHIAL